MNIGQKHGIDFDEMRYKITWFTFASLLFLLFYLWYQEKINWIQKSKLYFSVKKSGTISHFIIETFNHWLAVSLNKRSILLVTSTLQIELDFGDKETRGADNCAFCFHTNLYVGNNNNS